MFKEMLKSMVAAEMGISVDDVAVKMEEPWTEQSFILVEISKYEGGERVNFRTHIDCEKVMEVSLGELVKDIVRQYKDSVWINNVDKKTVLSNVIVNVVNTAGNLEILEHVPHRKVLDLTAVPCIEYKTSNGGKIVAKITKSLLEKMDVSEEQLFEAAYSNTPRIKKYRLIAMEDMLAELGLDFAKEAELNTGVCVLTSCDCRNGASAICFPEQLDKCANIMGSDIYILPSSVHEILLVPCGPWINADELSQMVTDLNGSGTVVSPSEILSNSVYRYYRKTKEVKIA